MLTLYSTGCFRCEFLKSALQKSGIAYHEVTDIEVILDKGFIQFPIVEDENGETYLYAEALRCFVFREQDMA